MLRGLFCFYFPSVERFLMIKCQKTNRVLTDVSQFMCLISYILDSSMTLYKVIYPFLPRTLGQVHWQIHSFITILLEVQNVKCILQGTRDLQGNSNLHNRQVILLWRIHISKEADVIQITMQMIF